MKRYTSERKDGYGYFYDRGEEQYIFTEPKEAEFVENLVNEKQDTIDAQNKRADDMNKRNSQLEADNLELIKINAEFAHLIMKAGIHFEGFDDWLLEQRGYDVEELKATIDFENGTRLSKPIKEIKD